MEFDELSPVDIGMMCRTCGSLEMPYIDDFEPVENLSPEVLSRISQAKSLAGQAAKILGG